MTGVALVQDWVRTGRIAPAQGAMLLQLRRDLILARQPRWRKVARFLGEMLFS